MIRQPSQYDCDNMEIGDVVFVQQVSPIYRLIRKYLFPHLTKIKVRDGWKEPVKYNTYYQEDCTLIYAYEMACVQKYNNEVPCLFSNRIGGKTKKSKLLSTVQISLYDIHIALDNSHAITIPLSFVHKALEDNQRILKQFDDNRKIKEAIKFQKYKGDYFKSYVVKNNITEWVPVYCSVCGKPVIFNFKDDEIYIDNTCECNSLNFPLNKISYDEFALWYANQIVTPSIIKRYNDFWFKKGD